jgi:outer membrane protein insertion porin family
MKKIALATILALMVALPGMALAEPVKVVVFPFDVFSRQPLDKMGNELQAMLIQRLAAEGVSPLAKEEINRALKEAKKPLDLTLARVLAGRLGADYAVYGSLTKIGARVSLDAKVLDSLGMARPQSVFVEGTGLDDLKPMSERLAREIAAKMSGVERVAEVKIEGNQRIESEAIKAVIKSKAGGPYSPIKLDQDLRAIWKMGYFDDVRIKTSDGPAGEGKIVTVMVKEKPMIREVQINGASAVDQKDIRDQIGVKPFSVYKPAALKEAEAKIVRLYHDKGYFDAKVTSSVIDLPSGDKGVKFDIVEGNKVFIKAIKFRGNKSFDADDLRDQMTTQEEGWFTWLTDANVLDRTKLEQDREKLTDFYYNNGYMTARVGEAEITRETGGLVVTYDISEGPRFKVASISASGEMVIPQKKLMEQMQLKAGEWFNREKLRMDLRMMHDTYADRGYAYVEVRPQLKEDKEKNQVAINYNITKGQKVYFERIIITGNTHTRDNVIRRELGVAEGDLFSSRALRNGNIRLHRLNFFEDVHLSTEKGATPEQMNLKINVKEKRTGSFSIGAGYSTVDNLMLMGSISEANLFGRGQRLELRGTLGGSSTRYTLSFTEPWLFDKPISAGADIYDWFREYTNYDKQASGVRLRLGWPTPWDYTRLYTYYTFEQATVDNVSDNAARIIRDQRGDHTTSAVRTILRRDSRNHNFNPTAGSDNSLSLEYAGSPIGGTNAFVKAIADSGWYFQVWWRHVIVVHGRAGWITGHSGGDLPIYERFFLGGINTLRGFDFNDVGPKDPETGDVIGGELMAQANLEYRFPIVEKAGLLGLVFYDTGNSWLKDEGYDLGNLRKSAGVGIRWLSPMGPLRLEYGWVLDPQPGETTSNWEFTIGSLF